MRSTNIQYLIELKKSGQNIFFVDCPQCKRFFGTTIKGVEACSLECEAEYALAGAQFELNRENRLSFLSLSKPYI